MGGDVAATGIETPGGSGAAIVSGSPACVRRSAASPGGRGDVTPAATARRDAVGGIGGGIVGRRAVPLAVVGTGASTVDRRAVPLAGPACQPRSPGAGTADGRGHDEEGRSGFVDDMRYRRVVAVSAAGTERDAAARELGTAGAILPLKLTGLRILPNDAGPDVELAGRDGGVSPSTVPLASSPSAGAAAEIPIVAPSKAPRVIRTRDIPSMGTLSPCHGVRVGQPDDACRAHNHPEPFLRHVQLIWFIVYHRLFSPRGLTEIGG